MKTDLGWVVFGGEPERVRFDWLGIALWAGGMRREGGLLKAGDLDHETANEDAWIRHEARWAWVLEVGDA